jgi:hypothetical protein
VKPKKYENIQNLILSDDPIDLHIIDQLQKAKHQNKRYKDQIKKSGNWTHLKDINDWKPYDFYNYFCIKYNEMYKKEYRLSGNVVRAYNKIESFIRTNHIENDEYKEFIDLLFSRYFNRVFVAMVGNICSPTLYNKYMGQKTKKATTEDLFNLDQQIEKENEAFVKSIKEKGAIQYGSQGVKYS